MAWKEVPAAAKKKDYTFKYVRLREKPPKQRHQYDQTPELPIQPGNVARIWMRRSFREAVDMNAVDVRGWPEGRILELRWQCPFYAEHHSVLIPESWIAERKVVFVESDDGE